MNQFFWRRAGVGAALVIVSFAATVWLMRPKHESPAQQRAATATEQKAARPEALSSSFGVLGPAPALPGINGRWVGGMDGGGGPKLEFRFDLLASDGRLTGTAVFPIGEAPILNGTISGNHLSFSTQHRLSTGQLVSTSVSGEMTDQELALKLKSEGAVSQLLVHRAAR